MTAEEAIDIIWKKRNYLVEDISNIKWSVESYGEVFYTFETDSELIDFAEMLMNGGY
jgi:hypothetical protein